MKDQIRFGDGASQNVLNGSKVECHKILGLQVWAQETSVSAAFRLTSHPAVRQSATCEQFCPVDVCAPKDLSLWHEGGTLQSFTLKGSHDQRLQLF